MFNLYTKKLRKLGNKNDITFLENKYQNKLDKTYIPHET